jgi:hypothetical protein
VGSGILTIVNLCRLYSQTRILLPEYPHNPAAHLNSPTAMRINGRISHCDKELLAGHNRAARGYDGLLEEDARPDPDEDIRGAGSVPFPEPLTFRRGLCGDGVGPAIRMSPNE